MSVKLEKDTVLETVSLLLFAAVQATGEATYTPGLSSLTVGLEAARAEVLNLLPSGHSFSEKSHHLAETAEAGERSVLEVLESAWKLVSELPVEPGLTELVVEISNLLREARHVGQPSL
ncbi:hypothetical protein OG984_09290 [Nocardioides sp. NBC_00368]|uniref:hypothetical protein n=1 Tax=Nocardioides sp. NBC_00368 TaxID=2976000 RepID=UPI002E1E5185